MEKKINRDKLIKFRAAHPGMKQVAIAGIFHITKQRVGQIFHDEDRKSQNAQPAPSSPVADQFHIEQESK